ncbi:MAG: hypothetical protein QM811_02725 [Pirellulales bacterium]
MARNEFINPASPVDVVLAPETLAPSAKAPVNVEVILRGVDRTRVVDQADRVPARRVGPKDSAAPSK